MKVLFIETNLKGHHISYLNSIIEPYSDGVVCLPEDSTEVEQIKKYIVSADKKNKLWYFKWISEINKIVKEEKPDIVHFLYGDDLYRFWGINFPKNVKKVITCHQVRRSRLRDLAYKRISSNVDAVVVHTDKLKKDFETLKIKNVCHIEYPHFGDTTIITESKEKLGIKGDTKVILAIGATHAYKGLDFLLEALNNVKQSFVLLVAGAEKSFDESYIDEHTKSYAMSVKKVLKFLSDEEFSLCLNAADIVCLPYRKSFDGASGPLGEGVALGKMIVGANHGSLGQIIELNHLGYTFETENVNALAEVLDEALSTEWKPDEKYLAYKELISPRRFQREYAELYKQVIKE